MFTQALLKLPAASLVDGITTANLGKPDHALALKQHDLYRRALEDCEVSVTLLEADDSYPDSVFIEDTAVVTDHFAIITRPGAESRRGETGAVQQKLAELFGEVHTIESPAMLDGGDVMQCGSRFFVGLSGRTNREGVNQFSELVKDYGYSTIPVTIGEMLHLKSGVSYLENDTLLIAGDMMDHPHFKDFQRIAVPPEEAYAANSLWLNERILIPEGYPLTAQKLKEKGYQVIPVSMSEFRKLDGGLSCLSLRF